MVGVPRSVNSNIAATRALGGSRARGDARLVMIAEHPVGRGIRRKKRFVSLDGRGDLFGLPWQSNQLKIERQVRASSARAVVGHQSFHWQINLPYQHAIVI